MAIWPQNPRIYELNTLVWLTDLSQKYGTTVTLSSIPEQEIERLASYHIDAVWLMGIWHRGDKTRASALNYIHEYAGALPDVSSKDIAGSAYAIGAYCVEEQIGGRIGLQHFRLRLHERGIKLILDFVPNHTGLDHKWLKDHPEYYVQGNTEVYQKAPGEFFRTSSNTKNAMIFAHGRDPYFPGWIDTAQLNAMDDGYRQAAVETLCDIASLADGVRCDMAMLVMNDIFMRSWGWLGFNSAPEVDFWNAVIPQVKQDNPDFIFIAEAYWNLNYALLEQGFDYTYDKTLYDRLLEGNVNGVHSHLLAERAYLERQIRFIENHDEMRAADVFGIERSRPAAVMICTLPGATLLHEGQFTGRTVKLPVHITRQPYEREHDKLKRFYVRLLEEADDEIYQSGEWHLFHTYPVCENCRDAYNLIVYGWRQGNEFRLIVLNLSGEWSQAYVDLDAWSETLHKHDWVLLDVLHRTYIEESGQAMANEGFRIELDPYQAYIYHLTAVEKRKRKRVVIQSRA